MTATPPGPEHDPAVGGGYPPGWYPDPERPELLRYWSGRAWTDHTHGEPARARRRAPARIGSSGAGRGGRIAGVVLLVAILVGGGVYLLVSRGSDDDPAAPADLPDGAVRHVDDELGWEMWVDPSWTEPPPGGGLDVGVAMWMIGTVDGFTDNVNVNIDDLPAGMSVTEYLADYVDVSLEQVDDLAFEIEVLGTEEITLAHGGPGARLEVRNALLRDTDVQQVAIVAVGDDQAVIATLSTTPERADAVFAEVEPYLETLRVR